MKKFVVIALSFVMLFIFPLSAHATLANTSISETIVFEDGSYIIATISEKPSLCEAAVLLASSKTGTKTIRYYTAGNTLEWAFSVTGTFTYDGITAQAISATASHNIYLSGWTCTGEIAWYSGSTASASATFKNINLLTKNASVSLSCSPNGTLS